MNYHIFVRYLKETKKIGGIDLITKIDEEDRYYKAEVVFSDESTPLKPGMKILFDKMNGHQYQHGDEMLVVLHAKDVVGILEKG